MRRSDREITDKKTIDEIIKSCTTIRLGFNDNGRIYLVPLNFGYVDGIFYFHSASEGRKVELIKTCPTVGFELDCGYQLVTGETAYDYTARFKSVIGEGKVKPLTSKDDKIKALSAIMSHYSKKVDWNYPQNVLDEVFTFCLKSDTLSCKWHK